VPLYFFGIKLTIPLEYYEYLPWRTYEILSNILFADR